MQASCIASDGGLLMQQVWFRRVAQVCQALRYVPGQMRVDGGNLFGRTSCIVPVFKTSLQDFHTMDPRALARTLWECSGNPVGSPVPLAVARSWFHLVGS